MSSPPSTTCDALVLFGATGDLAARMLLPALARLGAVAMAFAQAELPRGARIALEKPFGHDLESARALERTVAQAFAEDAVFRIDHFLGKDPVHNLADMRCATAWLEPLWSQANVRRLQITMAESFGIGTRGAFYEEVGVLRDVFQNHLLQLVAIAAMEPVPLAEGLHIDAPRFAGVPFYVRAGKRLPLTGTTVSLALTRQRALRTDAPASACDHLRFRIGPGAVDIELDTHRLKPGSRTERAPLALAASLPRDEDRDAYVNLLGAALHGDHAISERAAGVTAAWRVVEPLLRAEVPVHPYAEGSWGPAEAEHLLLRGERWHDPPPAP